MSEGSGHEGLWTEPKYPGDAVRIQLLHRNGEEIGDIRIQHISDETVKVCAFLPGETEWHVGDTPKTWPEFSRFCKNKQTADAAFDEFIQMAYAEGWQNYEPNSG